jgi:hypothetical protein
MKTWQDEYTAIHYTDEKLTCCFCNKPIERAVELDNKIIGFNCCFIKNLSLLFKNKEFMMVRAIVDVLFHNRKEIRKKEREKLTLKLRYFILKRDNFKCSICGKSSIEQKLEIDHIIPISKNGKTIKNNLRTLCFDCNRGKRDE